eukprot:TRINITY_DN2200_c0_g1_i1.p2 TRINITY_DN2200_c0_g1~~TRINITY_DN2200_c0_g1_i1.p2  ORF type:complete len:200 (+),score=39.52 TRINITY_DN2200_c0_g1_i1:64-663(+)
MCIRDRLKKRDKEIEGLKDMLENLEYEKQEMIDNFQTSTNLLIEKLKDLETTSFGIRPQTANILNRMPGGRIEQPRLRIVKDEEEKVNPDEPTEKCTSCKKMIPVSAFDAHLIQCYRNLAKCKVCGDFIARNAKVEHLQEWRNPDRILFAIERGDKVFVAKAFEHGADKNYRFLEHNGYIQQIICITLSQSLILISCFS